MNQLQFFLVKKKKCFYFYHAFAFNNIKEQHFSPHRSLQYVNSPPKTEKLFLTFHLVESANQNELRLSDAQKYSP